MADHAPTTARKRLRLGDPDGSEAGSPQEASPGALQAQPANLVAEFAARAGRVQALQQELEQVQERAQRQAAALEETRVELVSLKVSAQASAATSHDCSAVDRHRSAYLIDSVHA